MVLSIKLVFSAIPWSAMHPTTFAATILITLLSFRTNAPKTNTSGHKCNFSSWNHFWQVHVFKFIKTVNRIHHRKCLKISLSCLLNIKILSHQTCYFFLNIFYCTAWYNISYLHQPSAISGVTHPYLQMWLEWPGLRNSLSCDLYIESTFMWYGHSPMGI